MTAWAKLEKVVGAPDRLQRLADDVAEHFTGPLRGARGQGDGRRVLAGGSPPSSPACCASASVTTRSTCVISAQATDPPEHLAASAGQSPSSRSSPRRSRIPTDPLRLVVVKDMWLTGFDAPVLHTLYIDKPMRDHGLLQAIARVNRVFRDKPGGLVVDYIGIGEDLRASLQRLRRRPTSTTR